LFKFLKPDVFSLFGRRVFSENKISHGPPGFYGLHFVGICFAFRLASVLRSACVPLGIRFAFRLRSAWHPFCVPLAFFLVSALRSTQHSDWNSAPYLSCIPVGIPIGVSVFIFEFEFYLFNFKPGLDFLLFSFLNRFLRRFSLRLYSRMRLLKTFIYDYHIYEEYTAVRE